MTTRLFRKISAWVIILTLTLGICPMQSFASTSITSVSIKINNNLEVGDTVNDSSINIGSSGGDINVYVDSEKYLITETTMETSDNKELKVGDEVKIKVKLEPQTDYYFKGSFGSDDVHVSGGEYSSCSKSNSRLTVIIKVKAIKGTFDAPQDVEWKDSKIGRAEWDKPDKNGTGCYEIVLRRGGSEIYRVKDFQGTSYNFYPYMTQKGNYTFRVRTVASTSKQEEYGKSSDWVTSDEYELDEDDVSDGSGATGTTDLNGTAGWVKNNNLWYYKYPDGSYKKNGWAQVDGKWYLFGSSGIMLTGWQSISSGTYYLNDSGAMVTGWVKKDNKWVYLNADTTSNTCGAMMKGTWLSTTDGRRYYMNKDGYMSEGWTNIGEGWYYFYPESGQMATNTTIDTFRVGSDGAWIR